MTDDVTVLLMFALLLRDAARSLCLIQCRKAIPLRRLEGNVLRSAMC